MKNQSALASILILASLSLSAPASASTNEAPEATDSATVALSDSGSLSVS